MLPEVEAEKEVELGTVNDGELAGAVWEAAESVAVVVADADKALLTSEASEDEALEMIDADAEARAEDASVPTPSELTMLDNSELIDEEMADKTLEAAEAATPLVIVGVASVVLEAVIGAPVPVVVAGKLVKPETEALKAVPVAVAEELSLERILETSVLRGARMLLKRFPDWVKEAVSLAIEPETVDEALSVAVAEELSVAVAKELSVAVAVEESVASRLETPEPTGARRLLTTLPD